MASTIAAITTGIGGIVTTADATGNLSLLSGTSTVVAVTSAGAAVTGTMSVSGATTLTGGLNTPLAVTSGGTGVATSTGSGANVLGTSPTLTTPTISTITSAAATALTLQSASTTAVTIDTSQNVGIGTSSPDNALTIQDAGAGVNKRFSIRNGDSTNNHKLIMGYNAGALSGFIPATSVFISGETNGGYGTLTSLAIGTVSATPIILATSNTEQMRIDSAGLLKFNSGYGSVATAYGCRAWVNFNGTGTVAIRASGNVSSITDNGVGLYTINFTTAMPDVNYSWTSSVGYGTTLSGDALSVTFYGDFATYQLVGGFSVITTDPSNGGTYDSVLINISVFR